ncbi:hypothetical protein OC845_001301 [Tilletia horrida]|nr:hypothetical protein OC845_001301 [Tilletia horrida]
MTASAEVFGVAELVQIIAQHVATQDLAAFRLVNRFASIFGAPHQFTYHCFPWSKTRTIGRALGKNAEYLRHIRHIIVDDGFDSWESGGDDFYLTQKRRAQWSRLYDLLEAPHLTSLETVDLKASIGWACQMEQLTQPHFKMDNRLSNSLRSLCLTGITDASLRRVEPASITLWWNAVAALIEHCVKVQTQRGKLRFRHFHIGVEGNANCLCGPPTPTFITAFRAHLMDILESLTLGKISYATLRSMLGPFNIPPNAELSTQIQYQWPKWTNLRKLKISFGLAADIASSQLLDNMLNSCPELEELYLSFGPSQPVLLMATIKSLRHLCIEVPELVLGAHVRGERERDRLIDFITQQQEALLTLKLEHLWMRDNMSGRHNSNPFSNLPPVQLSVQQLPNLQACTGNYVEFRPSSLSAICRWSCTPPPAFEFTYQPSATSIPIDSSPNLDSFVSFFSFQLAYINTKKLTFLTVTISKAISAEYSLAAIAKSSQKGDLPDLAEIELDFSKDASAMPTTREATLFMCRDIIARAGSISTLRSFTLRIGHISSEATEVNLEDIIFPGTEAPYHLDTISDGVDLYDRTVLFDDGPVGSHSRVRFRKRLGRHHPGRARTLVEPEPRLPLWWGECYKLRRTPQLISFGDPFPSVLEHFYAKDENLPGVRAPITRSLPSERATPGPPPYWE